jgi:hypothetical protein
MILKIVVNSIKTALIILWFGFVAQRYDEILVFQLIF